MLLVFCRLWSSPRAAACVWDGINLLEGYGQNTPVSKSQGIKQLMAN